MNTNTSPNRRQVQGDPNQPYQGYSQPYQPTGQPAYTQPPNYNYFPQSPPAGHQPAPGGAPPAFGEGAAGFFGAPLPTAQLGLHLGNQALAVGQDYMSKNLDKYVPKQKLKAYFNVTNSYVLQKLLLIAFPYRHKSWQRLVGQQSAEGGAESYAPPRDDVNAPDLYIPMMAFVTYVLLMGLCSGLQSRFHPKVLGETASMVAILTFLEWGAIKLGLYLFNIGVDLNSLDILSLIGYNYVGLIAAVLAGILVGTYGKWLAFAFTTASMTFFVLRSMRQIFLPDTADSLVNEQRRLKRNFLTGIVGLQAGIAFLALLFK